MTEETTATAPPPSETAESPSDEALLESAARQVQEECYLAAAAHLRQIKDTSLLTEHHRHVLEVGARGARVKKDLLQPFDLGGWHKQTEIHGHRDTLIYYKVNPDASLVVRIETPIESSLLNPLLSVLNESELYTTWMPSFRFPRLGVQVAEKMQEAGRGNQVIRVKLAMPIPFYDRECIQHAIAIDAIENSDDEDSCILIVIKSLDEGTAADGLVIPAADKRVRRVDFDAGILIRPCPAHHPALAQSKNQYDGQELLLVQVTQTMDAHVAGVPMVLINFFTRTVLSSMWGSLLQVAEDVRDGQRPQHQELMKEHQELYDWVAARVQVMLAQIP